MKIVPAIDLIGGKAVRLLHGDYNKLTVYDNDPLAVAKRFKEAGAEWLHVVDLEGARDGNTPNIETVSALAKESGLKVEIGGGIRSVETAKKYNVPCMVSMNPIMIDGTGMCGGCRLSVDGQMKFACVDGPDFDGYLVDFDEMMNRNRMYTDFERHKHEETCNLYKKEVK